MFAHGKSVVVTFCVLVVHLRKFGVNAEVGTTVCTDSGTECDAHANTACDVAGGSLVCICNVGYVATTDNLACTYDCGADPNLADGSAASTSLTAVTYTCNTGLELVGTDTINCVEGTGWETLTATCQCPVLTAPVDGTVNADTGNTEVGGDATYTCNTGFKLAGDSTRNCVSGTGWDGAEPTCVTDCGALVTTGNLGVTHLDTVLNSVATYTCSGGFILVGTNTRTCLEAGWDGMEPTCFIDCGVLAAPANGAVTDPLTYDGQTATYLCDSDYQLVGNAARTCQNTGLWDGTDPSCVEDCGALTAPTNSDVIYANTILNEVATYTCSATFKLIGNAMRTCETGPAWSGTEPTCIEDCGVLDSPVDGTVAYPDTTVTNTATYSCNQDFRLVNGDATRTCQADSSWSGTAPGCIFDCGALVTTGNLGVTHPDTILNSIGTYTCNGGYVLVGTNTRTCLDDGWDGAEPTCLIDCGALTAPPNGAVSHPLTYDGQVATYSCDADYQLAGNAARTCENTGSWDGTDPSCVKDCGALTAPTNGDVTYANTILNEVATYTCSATFKLVGNAMRTCETGPAWSGTEPTCIEDCGVLDIPVDGTVAYPDTTVTNTATYSCNQDFRLVNGDATRTCQADGSWSGTAPGCTFDCGAVVTTGNLGVTHPDTIVNSVATYTCNGGYVLVGTNTRTCLDGGWDGAEPTCLIDCGALTAPANGAVFHPLTYDGQVATFSCDADYKLAGNAARTCQNIGVWDGTDPLCVEDCGALTAPTNGDVTYSNTILNEIATYTCSATFKLVGNAVRTCETGPAWSGTEPSCIEDCGDLTAPSNGGVSYTDTVLNEVATYSCLAGFQLSDDVTRTCQTDHNWSGTAPTCLAGQVGDDCSVNTALCDNIAFSACATGVCTCLDGYESDATSLSCTEIDECLSTPCANGGVCTDEIADYTCACIIGWSGGNCDVNPDDCTPNPCLNSGTCTDGLATYTCACVAGFEGGDCEININECVNHACEYGATCVDGINEYTCTCVPGYEGPLCGIDVNECASSPCQNGATCNDGVNGYICDCAPGYEGDTCGTEINECLAVTCNNGGTCNDLFNMFSCTCVLGYTGSLCETNIDDCPASVCQNGATCVDQMNGYACNCVTGYTGTMCATDIDDCATVTCENSGTCVDAVNSFTCECADGWGGTLCQNNLDDCLTHACVNGATCVDVVAGYTCTCVDGYEGQFCQTDTNECSSNPCQNGGKCVDEVNQYTCTCIMGYTGANCETNIDNCSPNPCDHGTCTDLVNDYTCDCEAGYDGKNCDNNIDNCLPPPCQNGGTCSDLVDDYYCACVAGYEDKDCSTDIDDCATNLCEHGATCVDQVNGYACQCVPGYNGDNCETDIDECASNQCLNSGLCQDLINGYDCVCQTGYTGTFCETDIDECFSSPCDNGGTCTDLMNSFSCACTDGHTGLTCRTGLLGDDCITRPEVCANIQNSECASGVCACVPGYMKTDTTVCSKKDCGTLAPIENGVVNYDEGTLYQASIYFSCDTGYARSGVFSIECLADGNWSGVAPTCNIVSCPTIDAPLNGTVVFLPNTEYQGSAEFVCDVGFSINGATARTCLSTGTWSSSSPICVINDCGPLTAPANGAVTQSGTVYTSIGQYECDSGYDLQGATSVTCTAAATWSDPRPTCAIKDCGALMAPEHGTMDAPSGTNYGARTLFSCNTGYQAVGATTLDCLDTGVWSDVEPTCEIKDCGDPGVPDNGSIDISGGTTYDSVVIYTCNAGFDINGVNQRTCRADQTWTNLEPTCDRISCGTLISPSFGTVDLTAGVLFEAVAQFSCNEGYTLNGVTSRTCQADTTWNGASPTCTIKNCGALTGPDNGQVLTVDGTTAGTTAQHSCDIGYTLVGLANRTCSIDGAWTGSPPTCTILDCGPVASIKNGAATYNPGSLYGSTVFYTCDTTSGYSIDGVSSRVCLASGFWSGSQPTCKLLDCGTPKNLTNGFSVYSGTKVGATATYACSTGYGLVGTASVSCLTSGYWDTLPLCSLDCGSPPSVSNSAVTIGSGMLVGGQATYTCDDGFSMSGAATVTCQAAGTWSKAPLCYKVTIAFGDACTSTPQCVTSGATCRTDAGISKCLCALAGETYAAQMDACLKICPTLPEGNLLYGSVVSPDILSAGQIAVYSCDAGYALSRPAIRTCLTSGIWSGAEPECTFGCPMPDSPENGYANVSDGMVAGNKVIYSCKAEYKLVGARERICQDDSTWTGLTPSCARECPELPALEHGFIDMSAGMWEGAQAVYVCEEEYGLVGKSTRTCEFTGQWGGREPRCMFAIYPKVILALGSLFIFLVLVDVFIVIFYFFNKHRQAQEAEFDRIEKHKEDTEIEDDSDDDTFNMPAPGRHVGPYNAGFYNRPRMYSPSPSEASSTHPPPKKSVRSKVIRGRAGSAIKSIFSKGRTNEKDMDDDEKAPYGATVFPRAPDATFSNGNRGNHEANSEVHNEFLDSSFEENSN